MEEKSRALEAELARLRAENERLKAELRRRENGLLAPGTRPAPVQLSLPLGQPEEPAVTKRSTLAEQVTPLIRPSTIAPSAGCGRTARVYFAWDQPPAASAWMGIPPGSATGGA